MEQFVLALMVALSSPNEKLERCKWEPDKPRWEYNGCADREGKADKPGKGDSDGKSKGTD
jgi:hypothetical protein